ncbi:MAG: OmpA family protein [Hyphomicrobiaceae bacterium]|nr:OmpA family protein [Hyphomicrobiaceae bacterium]
MRCNPLRWLSGVVLVVGLLGIMNLEGVLVQIEAELEQRSRTALAQAGLGWASVGFSGRDGNLTGKAADEKEQRQAFDIARSIWGVRTVRNRTELVEEQTNYVWSASLRENRLRLTGFVPNDATRKAIVGAAKATFPQLEIDDRMKRARGAPETEIWLGAVSFGLKQLSGLKAGARVDLDSAGLAVAGEAENFAAYRGIKSAMANSMPQGVRLKGDKVVPPVARPYVWTARLSGAQVQLGGFVPSERAREEVFAAAQKAFAQRVIVDRMQIASGEPADMLPAATGALHKLAQLEEGAAELKDDQLLLSGLAVKQETAEALRSTLAAGMPDSIRVTEQIQFREPTIKAVSPYTIAAAIDRETLALTGYVPSEPARAALTNAAQSRFPERKISDGLRLGSGAPEGWQACMVAGMSGLAKLGNGRIEMEDRMLRFAAVTDDEDAAEAIRSELRAAANRACELDFRIVVNVPPEPELNWRASTSEGEVLLEGEVPDEATKSNLALAAAKLFPNARLVDRMEVTAAYSKKWPKVTETGLKLLARLRTGEVRLAGLELVVSGQAPDTAVATVVRQQLRDLPKGYKGRDVVEVRSDAMIWAEQEAKRKAEAEARRKVEEEARRRRDEEARQKADEEQLRQAAAAEAARQAEAEARAAEEARRAAEAALARQAEQAAQERHAALAREQQAGGDGCQAAIAAATLHGTISFDRASSSLHKEALETLSRVLEVAAACPQAQIAIEGHTDAEGSPDRNQQLSERRAEAVVDYLVARGIPAGRLKAVGYGASRPVAPNDSPDSRAMNRRIEFIVKTD